MLLFWKPNQAYSNGMELFFGQRRYDAHLERFDVIATAAVAEDMSDFFTLRTTPTPTPIATATKTIAPARYRFFVMLSKSSFPNILFVRLSSCCC